MIKVVELSITDFGHEEFNAGLLWQLWKAYPKETIRFYGRDGHIKCLERLLFNIEKNQQIEFVRVDTWLKNNGIDEEILNRIRNDDESSNKLIFTSSTLTLYQVMDKFCKSNPDMDIYIEGHGEIEHLVDFNKSQILGYIYSMNPRSVIHVLKDGINQLKNHRINAIKRTGWRNAIAGYCAHRNAHLLLFSNAYRYVDFFSAESIRERSIFLHLPYIIREIPKKRSRDSLVRIGVFPKLAIQRDASVWKIIKYVERNCDRCQREFEFSLFRYYSPGWKHIKSYPDQSDERRNVVNFLENCDWILAPYAKDKYFLSTSGVVMDAIQYETPVFMYQSHCFDDLDACGVGIRKETIEALGEAIIDVINKYDNEESEVYTIRLREYKREMMDNNLRILRGLNLANE